MTQDWDPGIERFFNDLSIKFEDCGEHHIRLTERWKFIFSVATLTSMILSFTALCIEVLLRDDPAVKYSNFSEKIISVLSLAFLHVINPGDKANMHDKSAGDYLKMASRISTQLNKDVLHRKHPNVLMAEIKTQHDFTIERTKPPKSLNFPTAIYRMGETNRALLGDLYNSKDLDNLK